MGHNEKGDPDWQRHRGDDAPLDTMIASPRAVLRYNSDRVVGAQEHTMPRPVPPTPRPTSPHPTSTPADRLLILGLGATAVWVLGWVGIQLSGVLR